MKDTKFFEQALELVAPWKVVDVNMDLAAKRVEVKVDCGSAEMWVDPQSGQRLHIHGYDQRRWRHLPTMQFETIIVAQVPATEVSRWTYRICQGSLGRQAQSVDDAF